MMAYEKYKIGRQLLNCGHQRITYKKQQRLILTQRLTQSSQWIGVDHGAQIHYNVDRNK